ncbi:MAG: hypothetical protein PHO56_05415 [Patescibacteria group bacterium]|nr:hypothetical protein [Patescibacteria group bacterium]
MLNFFSTAGSILWIVGLLIVLMIAVIFSDEPKMASGESFVSFFPPPDADC